MQEEKGKKLNLFNLIGMGAGGAIGTGIFLLLGYGIAYTGRSIVIVVAVGCFYMLLAYWYHLAMSSVFVLRGGDYSMKLLTMPLILIGITAWFTMFNGFAFSSYTTAVMDYLVVLIPEFEPYTTLGAIILTTIVFALSIKGSRIITLVENYITVILFVAIAVFVLFGIPHVNFAEFFSNSDGEFWYGGFAGFIAAIAVMGWACQGTTMTPISMAAVTEQPKKNIPKSILFINVIVAVVYALMAYVAAGVLPYEEIAGQNISVSAQSFLPTPLYLFFVVGGGICAVLSSLVGGVAMMRYPLQTAAEDGWYPSVFKKTTQSGYPYVTYLVFYVITLIPLVTGLELDAIVSLCMIPTMLLNICMNILMITIPGRYPEQWEKRTIRWPVWLWDTFSILGAVFAAVVAYNLFIDLSMLEAGICVAIVVAVIILSIIRIKQNAVTNEQIERSRNEIMKAALVDETDTDK